MIYIQNNSTIHCVNIITIHYGTRVTQEGKGNQPSLNLTFIYTHTPPAGKKYELRCHKELKVPKNSFGFTLSSHSHCLYNLFNLIRTYYVNVMFCFLWVSLFNEHFEEGLSSTL